MVPIIPAIPRSLEKRTVKEDVKRNEDGRRASSPIRPISPKEEEESLVETATAQSEAVPNDDSNEKDDVQENGVQEVVIETTGNEGLDKGFARGKSAFQCTVIPKRIKADSLNRHHFIYSKSCSRLWHRETWLSLASPLLSEAVSTTSHLDRCIVLESARYHFSGDLGDLGGREWQQHESSVFD